MPKSTTNPVIAIGRIFYALAILAFGIQYAIFGHLRVGLPLCPYWLPSSQIIAYALAAILIAIGLALLAAWRTFATSLILGLLLLLTSCLYLQHLNFVLHDGNGRTLFLECLSLASTACPARPYRRTRRQAHPDARPHLLRLRAHCFWCAAFHVHTLHRRDCPRMDSPAPPLGHPHRHRAHRSRRRDSHHHRRQDRRILPFRALLPLAHPAAHSARPPRSPQW